MCANTEIRHYNPLMGRSIKDKDKGGEGISQILILDKGLRIMEITMFKLIF